MSHLPTGTILTSIKGGLQSLKGRPGHGVDLLISLYQEWGTPSTSFTYTKHLSDQNFSLFTDLVRTNEGEGIEYTEVVPSRLTPSPSLTGPHGEITSTERSYLELRSPFLRDRIIGTGTYYCCDPSQKYKSQTG